MTQQTTATPASLAGRMADVARRQMLLGELLLREEEGGLVEWPFPTMHDCLGPIRPGTVHIVAARPSNGKTTLMMNTFQSWLDQGKTVLYLGMEMPPEELRLQWAAWKAGFDFKLVINRQWSQLPLGARDLIAKQLDLQMDPGVVNRAIFADEERVTMADLNVWMTRAEELKVDVVVIDHLHRMDVGGTGLADHAAMAEAITQIKSLSKHYNIPFVVAAQVGRPEIRDALTAYIPPTLESLRQSGKIEEEADVVLGLSRALKPGVKDGDLKLVRLGMKPLHDIADRGTMAVRVLKHRLDGEQIGRDLHLYVHKNQLYDDRLTRDQAHLVTICAPNVPMGG